jgi:hypothetical protein
MIGMQSPPDFPPNAQPIIVTDIVRQLDPVSHLFKSAFDAMLLNQMIGDLARVVFHLQLALKRALSKQGFVCGLA